MRVGGNWCGATRECGNLYPVVLTPKTIVELMGRNTTLSKITTWFNLDQHIILRFHPTEHQMMKIRADVFEALVAAYWKDFGPEEGLEIIKVMIHPICWWIYREIRDGRLWVHQPRGQRNQS